MSNLRNAVAWGGVPVGEYHGGSAPQGRALARSGTHQISGDVDPDFVWKDPGRCQYEKADDSQCGAWPKGGEIYCGLHLRTMRTLDSLNAAVAESGE